MALAHDLGHSPFGHAGEWALDAALEGFGGFDHNIQTFRVVTRLEQRYALFDGLNLTAVTLESLVKHNGPLADPPPAIAEHGLADAMQLRLQAPLEAQLAAIADDIAYCNHDMDDGLRAGFFTLGDLAVLPIVGGIVAEVETAYPGVDRRRLIHEANRQLIDRMVADLVAETRHRLAGAKPGSAQDVREAGRPMAGFSGEMAAAVQDLRRFLHQRMYRHYKVNRMARTARRLVTELVELLLAAPDCLPDRWQERAGSAGSAATADAVRDYVAGHDRPLRRRRARPALQAHRLSPLSRPMSVFLDPSMNPFDTLLAEVHEALGRLSAKGVLPGDLPLERISVEPPREREHGDAATNAALILAKPARMKPLAIAEALAEELAAVEPCWPGPSRRRPASST